MPDTITTNTHTHAAHTTFKRQREKNWEQMRECESEIGQRSNDCTSIDFYVSKSRPTQSNNHKYQNQCHTHTLTQSHMQLFFLPIRLLFFNPLLAGNFSCRKLQTKLRWYEKSNVFVTTLKAEYVVKNLFSTLIMNAQFHSQFFLLWYIFIPSPEIFIQRVCCIYVENCAAFICFLHHWNKMPRMFISMRILSSNF